MQFKFRPSEERGGANHGWLKTFHTFSFADYYDPQFGGFGCLRVINEDRVDPKQGFPTHPHREFEIFSYLISGELSHKDTMGNVETMKRGDVQMTCGGTGIAHSEFNAHKSVPVHFLQIWAKPFQSGLKPRYYTRHFTDEDKRDKICEIVAPVGADGVIDEREGNGPTPVHAALHTFSTVISPTTTLTHTYHPSINSKPDKLLYIQLVQSSGYNTSPSPRDESNHPIINIKGGAQEVELGEGDGVFIVGGKVGHTVEIGNKGGKVGEVLIFEMDA